MKTAKLNSLQALRTGGGGYRARKDDEDSHNKRTGGRTSEGETREEGGEVETVYLVVLLPTVDERR